MYKIYANGILIYDDMSSDPYLKVASPKLSLEVNAAGSLDLTIPPGNAGYDFITRMATDISVTKDDDEIWFGRVLQEDKDFWNNRKLTCEGALAFLNDTTQPAKVYSNLSGLLGMESLIKAFLEEHNSHVSNSRKIYFVSGVDAITVSIDGDIECQTDYETTIECFNKFILDVYGGNIYIRRKSDGKLHLDYLADTIRTNTQKIEFGKNLMDFTTSTDSSEYATVVMPLGAKKEKEEGYEGPDEYITVTDLDTRDESDPCRGTRYVGNSEAIGSYGWIEVVIHFDDADTPSRLYQLALQYLADIQFDTMEISLSALDLHYLNPEIMGVTVGDSIYVISAPHGLNRPFPVLKMDIPLDSPQNTMFQLGGAVKTSLTSMNNRLSEEIRKQVEEAIDLDEDQILRAAQDNAAALLNQKTNGFITITTDEYGTNELYISEVRPVINDDGTYAAQRFWKWNMNGLGYTDDYGVSYKTAITMDGSIVGERIAAGSIHGSKITAGSLAITKSTGEEVLKLGLQARGLSSDALVIGDIAHSGDDGGKNIESDSKARTVSKTYLSKDTAIGAGYLFEAFRYTDNEDPESAFASYYESTDIDTGTGIASFTVPITGYYRFVFIPFSTPISDQDLVDMTNSVTIGGSSATITAEDLHIFGMVTFHDLSDPGKTTEINGDYITTGKVKANRIDLHGLIITNNDPTDIHYEETTFEVDQYGKVTVNGNIVLSSSSTISFGGGTTKTIGDISTEASDADEISKRVAYGLYTPPPEGVVIDGERRTEPFIDNRTIFAPTLIGNEIVAQSENDQTTGYFVLRDGASTPHNRLAIHYTSATDNAPGIFFNTDGESNYIYHFDKPIEVTGGMLIENTNVSSQAMSYIHGRFMMQSDSIFAVGGKMTLTYNVTYVSNYEDLPANAEPGQICFVLN